jgi:tRNA (guanine37-N1)-methyltransferase
MRIDILTIFPTMFDSFLGESLLKKGIDAGIIDVRLHDIRAYTDDKHRRVDDEPYGGGAGMVMTPQPMADAIESVVGERRVKKILLTPGGKPLRQSDAIRLSKEENLLFVCGRYEGIDQRVSDLFIDEEISIGDFVLNGGEVAAMALTEALFRLLPGAVGKEESVERESFAEDLLEHPHYTRPEEFRGLKAPEILLSGHHAKIEEWRKDMSVKKTAGVRPDLLARAADARRGDVAFSLALIHYPILGKSGETITGSVTTIDVHDLARIGKTYGARAVYVVTPVEDQRRVVERIREHWMEGDVLREIDGRRTEALDILKVVTSIEAMTAEAKRSSGKKIRILATSAVEKPESLSADEWLLSVNPDEEWIVLFGTAYGLAPELLERADALLKPIVGAGEFNHLPVRGASAIISDWLFGKNRRLSR